MADTESKVIKAEPPSLTESAPVAAAPVEHVTDGLDTTVPGGRYIVGGQAVDAEGRPVGKKK